MKIIAVILCVSETRMKTAPWLLPLISILVCVSAHDFPRPEYNAKATYLVSGVSIKADKVNSEYLDPSLTNFSVVPKAGEQSGFEITFVYLKDLPEDTEVIVKDFDKAPNGNYTESFNDGPFHYCQFLKESEVVMQSFLKASNFTDCPPKKGTYVVSKWVLDESKFPREIPIGWRARAEFTFQHNNTVILQFEYVVEVIKPA